MKWTLTLLLLVPILGTADLRDYDHPLVCKPVIIRNGVTFIADQKDWITLPWKDFKGISDRLLFKHLDGLFKVPLSTDNSGYVCSQ